jgi:hypothetical protein
LCQADGFHISAQERALFVVKCGTIQSSGCFAAVAFQQPAQALLAADLRQGHDLVFDLTMLLLRPPALLRPFHRIIAERLVRPFLVVVGQVRSTQMVVSA